MLFNNYLLNIQFKEISLLINYEKKERLSVLLSVVDALL